VENETDKVQSVMEAPCRADGRGMEGNSIRPDGNGTNIAGLGTFSYSWHQLPSGKHTKNYGKSPCLMGKSTISMAIFNSKLLVYQRVVVS